MKVYQTQFKKKNGELRDIKYVKPFAEQADASFFDKNIKGVKSVPLPRDSERVWDIEAQGFRVINFNELTQPIDCIAEATYDEQQNKFIINE